MVSRALDSARQHRRQPTNEAAEVSRLDPDAPLPLELANQTLARGREAEQAAARAADLEREIALVAHEVPVIDHVASVHVDRLDAAVAREPELTVTRHREE